MLESEKLHGGLIFTNGLEQGLDGICRIVSSTLEDYGYAVDRQTLSPMGQARITSARISVRIELLAHEDGRSRLVLDMATAGASRVDPEEAQLVLLVMMYRILEATPIDEVEWLDPDVVIPADRFLGVFTKVSPRRVRGRQQIMEDEAPRFSPVEETAQDISGRIGALDGHPESEQEAVCKAFRTMEDNKVELLDCDLEEPDTDIRRLASWGMTGVVVLMSGPVGASMAAVNLLRGEDFRLNTHVLALTGFLGFATSTSAMAQVASILPV